MALILTKRITLKVKTRENFLSNFPKSIFILLALTAVFLSPISNKLIGLYTEHYIAIQNINFAEYLEFYAWFITGIGLSRWIVLFGLVFIFLNKNYSKSMKI